MTSNECASLDRGWIEQNLHGKVATARLEQLEVFASVDSTNTYLKKQPPPAAGAYRVAIAEHQTAGRGRQGNQWLSTAGGSLCLSVAWQMQNVPNKLSALTLAVGLGAAEALASLGVGGVQLKWPNDLLVGNAKLAGILTETVFRSEDNLTVVVGVGVNLAPIATLSEDDVSSWADAATSLGELMPQPPAREALAVALVHSLVDTCKDFEAKGFAAFASRFGDYDWLAGKHLDIDTPEGPVNGIAVGIAGDGALLVDTAAGREAIYSGSVQRAAALASAS
jgi:BirA family biotin operon repressor/biotin-[acetyl-CoA-carboxylase] ligase